MVPGVGNSTVTRCKVTEYGSITARPFGSGNATGTGSGSTDGRDASGIGAGSW